jgi:autotransporter-associated beta strand protein
VLAICAVSASCLSAAAGSLDGVFRSGSPWGSKNWDARDLWDYHRLVQNGGVAYLMMDSFGAGNKLNMNVNGLKLAGLQIETLTTPIYSANGYSLNMCGASPFIGRTATSEFLLELPLVGDGTNVLRKTGAGLIRFQAPVQDFGAFELWEGKACAPTNSAANPAIAAADVPVVLRGGQLRFDAANSETTVGELRAGPGAGRVTVANGATVTLGTLSREPGGVAVLTSDSGVAALGDTEKVLVSGRATDAAGQMDGSLITLDEGTASRPLDFLTYDGTTGFARAGAGTALVSGGNVAGIADVAEDTTVSDDTSVSALRIKEGAALTLDAGTTLTVGDGTHPAGVLFQGSATATKSGSITGDGTVAFGGQEGVFWFSCATEPTDDARRYAFNTKVSGTAGVTFAARRINSGDRVPLVTLPYGYTAGWTGPTHIAGLRLRAGTAAFPGDVWLDGNSEANSAQLCPSNQTWAQHFHISGKGLSATTTDWTLYFAQGTTTFTGGIDLLSPAAFHAENTALVNFNSPITGTGGLALQVSNAGSYMRLGATNTYAGATEFISSAPGTLMVPAGGTLGLGPVTLTSGNLLFLDQKDAVVSNDISGASGILRFRDSTVALAGKVDVGTLRLADYSNTTTIAIHDLAVKQITAERTSRVTALDADSVLTVGADSDVASAISCQLEDGAGRLSLVKRGTNTIDVFGRKGYTGATVVKAGTLRLQANLTNSADIVWWIDPSDESTVDADANQRVTTVRSKVGGGVTFGQYASWASYGLPHYDGTTVNGLKVLRYSCIDVIDNADAAAKDGSWLVGNKRTQQRSVVMVAKPRMGKAIVGNNAIFGASGRDMGMRLGNGTFHPGRVEGDGASYCTTGGFRCDGVVDAAGFQNDEVHVLVMRQRTERFNGQYSAYSDFAPTIGGYATWSQKDKGWLGFNGEMCEVIAFNRYISDDEAKVLENALSLKWRGEAIHADAPALEELVEQSDLLPTATDLEIYADATFDLNGVSQTVKTLSGQGRIVNSSATPATLTVTDGITFRGTIGAGVTLLKGDGGAAALDLRVETGAALGATNGTLAVSSYVELPVTNNIGFWCDASYRPDETILRDEDGGVTNWIPRMGTVPKFSFVSTSTCKYCVTKPTYSAAAYGGRGAVVFTRGECALYPSANCNLRTVFLLTKVSPGGLYLFGRYYQDLSFRTGDTTVNLHGQYNFNPVGALFHVNGIDYTETGATSVPMPSNPFLITAGSETWQGDYSNYNCRWVLGCNMNSNGRPQEMAEIICYTEKLTDEQIARVEDYLMKKWGLKGGGVKSYADVFAEGADISLGGTGILDAQGAAVSVATLTGAGGSVTNFSQLAVTDAITLDVVNGVVEPLSLYGDVTFGTTANGHDIPVYIDDWRTLDSTHPSQRAVSVASADGATPPTVTGTLHAADALRNWALTRSGNTWSVARTGMMIIFR